MAETRPIRPTDRVAQVLARDDALLEILLRRLPGLERLRHPAFRTVMAKLTTLQQAAELAGVPVAPLVRELNRALGVGRDDAPPTAPGTEPAEEPADGHPPPAGAVEVELDVRDDLRSGREPFSRIVAAVNGLGDGEVLRLRATFRPVPLLSLLGRRGLAHHVECLGEDDWVVRFYRAASPAAGPPEESPAMLGPSTAPPTGAPAGSDLEWVGTEAWLDVRGLEPPEPLVRTLAALEELSEQCTLVQVNVRVPQHLLPILAERGFSYQLDQSRSDRVLTRICRAGSHPSTSEHGMQQDVIELDVRTLAPRQRHATIFAMLDALDPGHALVLVNDHDPRPLRYQLLAERPDGYDWTYEAEGPDVWQVRIVRR